YGQTQRMLLRNVGNIVAGSIDRVSLVFSIPFSEVGGLVHVFDDLSPADTGVVSAEGNFPLLGAVGNYAHLCAAKVIVKEILKPHAFDTEHSPDVVRVFRAMLRLHAIVAIGIRISRRWLKQVNDLGDREAPGRPRGVEVSHDRHAEL